MKQTNILNKQKFISIGEILLRLSPNNYGLLKTADSFDINYGGSEANVAVSLANLGIDSSFFTILPNNDIGKAAARNLKSNDVNTSKCIFDGDRLGLYYLEAGFGARSSKVIYDRKNSAIAEYDFSNIDFKEILKDYIWLHLSGITPALSQNCKILIEKALKNAKELNITVSFDGNYRSALWSLEEARNTLTPYLPYIDVLIGVEPFNIFDENGKDAKVPFGTQPTFEEQKYTFETLAKQYNFKAMIRHNRYTHSASENSLKAYLWYDGKTYESNLFRFNILDRVGGGDALTAGFIYSIMNNMEPMDMLNFSLASSVFKHTMHGDFNINDNKDAILKLMKQNYEIQR